MREVGRASAVRKWAKRTAETRPGVTASLTERRPGFETHALLKGTQERGCLVSRFAGGSGFGFGLGSPSASSCFTFYWSIAFAFHKEDLGLGCETIHDDVCDGVVCEDLIPFSEG